MSAQHGGGRGQGGRKSSQGGRGSQTQSSPVAIARYLKGIEFPADKQELLDQARENGAPQDVIHVLEQFQEREYGSPADVAKEVGRIE